MLHNMKLQPGPFHLIKTGQKTVELRLYDEKRKKVQVDDKIEFMNLKNKTQKIRVRVTALHPYDDFAQLYADKELLRKCGYDESEIANADPHDMDQYYSIEQQEQYGVIGIEVELLDWRSEELTKIGRFLCFLLRHNPQAAGILLDRHGWADVEELIAGVNRTEKYSLTKELLEEIVDTDEKQRYSYNEDHTKIRANQGHSIPVDVELEELEPPEFLWHGTGEKYVESIDEKGLMGQTRLYVHLSVDYETAVAVGRRHGKDGKAVVYRVKSKQMYEDGCRFYRAVNGVWLTKYVPVCYLEK